MPSQILRLKHWKIKNGERLPVSELVDRLLSIEAEEKKESQKSLNQIKFKLMHMSKKHSGTDLFDPLFVSTNLLFSVFRIGKIYKSLYKKNPSAFGILVLSTVVVDIIILIFIFSL